jgi:hypothetical protein
MEPTDGFEPPTRRLQNRPQHFLQLANIDGLLEISITCSISIIHQIHSVNKVET